MGLANGRRGEEKNKSEKVERRSENEGIKKRRSKEEGRQTGGRGNKRGITGMRVQQKASIRHQEKIRDLQART